MKPSSWDKQLGLASPLQCAAIQSGQTNHPSKNNEVGLDVSHHIHLSLEGRGKYFFLDILSHRMSVIGICTKPLARRTLPRVRGSAVGEGLRQEVSWVTEKGGPRDPTTPKDAGGTPAP